MLNVDYQRTKVGRRQRSGDYGRMVGRDSDCSLLILFVMQLTTLGMNGIFLPRGPSVENYPR